MLEEARGKGVSQEMENIYWHSQTDGYGWQSEDVSLSRLINSEILHLGYKC